MKYRSANKYLLSKPEVIEDYPFGPDVAVFKIRGKMFATLAYSEIDSGGKKHKQARMNLKCDPDQALMLRKIFPAVLPGYHMNKRHWNTVCLDGSLPKDEIVAMIDHSFCLVINGLKSVDKQSLKAKYGVEMFNLS